MQQSIVSEARAGQPMTNVLHAFAAVAVTVVIFLAVYNLTEYPLTWFDEGSHLHVPKTFVRLGVYADYSSDGFRYYGPTIGVGPTVLLPIALIFKFFGVGLFQARLVMAVYLLGCIYMFFRLAGEMGGARLAWAATALVVASRGVGMLEYGRQVLGEVPGFFFIGAGLAVWFATWEKTGWRRLVLVGLLLGLAMVTKYQYLLVLAPAIGLAWIANLVYYRTAPHRVFIIPGLVAGVCFALWQVYLILYLGPATASENFAELRQAASGAAMVFSPSLMQRAMGELTSFKVYMGMLLPAVIYGVALALSRRRDRQRWGVLAILAVVNLVWYVVASVSWLRYAFLGMAIASLFLARLFYDLTDGFQMERKAVWEALRRGQPAAQKHVLRWTLLAWLMVMIVLPLGKTTLEIVQPEFNAPTAMAAYLDENVPREALIETWEPEMEFLTDHNYHFPPSELLAKAVSNIWSSAPPPSQFYDFVQTQQPKYVLVGEFARWVKLYPDDWLADHYRLVTRIGAYDLYLLK